MKQNPKFQTKFPLIILVILSALIVNTSSLKAQITADDPHMGIIPAPASVTKSAGTFTFSNATQIKADDPKNRAVIWFKNYLAENLHLHNKIIKNSSRSLKGAGIYLTAKGAKDLPNEGYKLTITPHKITIIGKGAGLFYGIQTLIQLLPVDHTSAQKLPCAIIADEPRFGYRGMMLDVSRHFFTVPQVKKIIEVMASL